MVTNVNTINSMTTYELETGTIGFREIPNDGNIFNTGITANNPIPDGFELLGIFSQLKEEDVKDVMPKVTVDLYKNYIDPSFYMERQFKTALESIHSLAQHLGLNAVNPYKDPCDSAGGKLKNDCIDSCQGSCWNSLDYTYEDFEEAQSKVKQYFVLFKPKQ